MSGERGGAGAGNGIGIAGGSGNACCNRCVRALKWLPVLFILSIVVWSYYAYVVQLCFLSVESNFERAIYLVFYHLLFAMFCWSYWQTIFTDVGRVPAKFKIPDSEVEKLLSAENEEAQRRLLEMFAQDLPVYNRTLSGAIRYCERCVHIKPDRTHHCSVCGTCVLKMDHHCPWVNNCVSFYNYKFFILFLGYALLYCIYIALTNLQYFVRFWKGDLAGSGRFHILFLFFVAVMFAISLVSFFGYHCYLVMQNRSTLEAFRAPIFRSGLDKNGFSLGRYNNFQEVFGDNPKTWLLPIFTSNGDGSEFPVSGVHQHRRLTHIPAPSVTNQGGYDSMGITQSSMGDGVSYPQRHLEEDAELLLGCDNWADPPPFSSASPALLYEQ